MANSISVNGRVTKDPAMVTHDGKQQASFTVADNQYKSVNGERQQETLFFDCLAKFGNEYLVNNLKKGMQIYICLLYTSPSPRDGLLSRMPSSA